MKHFYLIKDSKQKVIGGTFELEKAIKIIEDIRFINKENCTYTEHPFFKLDSTVINIIAGPIPKELLKS